MDTIPAGIYEHIDALKSYPDGLILRWLSLRRGTTQHIQAPGNFEQFPSHRTSCSSSNPRSSNGSSLFSNHHRRNSANSWSTRYSHTSTLWRNVRDNETGYIDETSPIGPPPEYESHGWYEPPPPLSAVFHEQEHSPGLGTVSELDDARSYHTIRPSANVNTSQPGRMTSSHASRSRDGTRTQRYYCTSCDETFARKWDWKHHEEEFHERRRQWICPDCRRDFYAENSFKKHHEKAHKCKKCPHASGALAPRETRIAWGCGICRALLHTWDERCSHVATHFEQGKTKSDWLHSKVIFGLLHQPDINDKWRNLVIDRHGRHANLQFSWNKKLTEEALEDLEFGRYPRDVDELVKKAYELGVRPTSRRSSDDKPLPLLPNRNHGVDCPSEPPDYDNQLQVEVRDRLRSSSHPDRPSIAVYNPAEQPCLNMDFGTGSFSEDFFMHTSHDPSMRQLSPFSHGDIDSSFDYSDPHSDFLMSTSATPGDTAMQG